MKNGSEHTQMLNHLEVEHKIMAKNLISELISPESSKAGPGEWINLKHDRPLKA